MQTVMSPTLNYPAPTIEEKLVERRQRPESAPGGVERRQFSSSYGDLSEDARQLAVAIDSYKLEYRRRYLTFEEMLHVIKQLGYHRESSS
jgi:hypothetical protein